MGFIRAGLDWTGLSGRRSFALSVAVFLIIAAAAAKTPPLSPVHSGLSLLAGGAFLIQMGHTRRRIRDLEWSGWTLWLSVVPLVGLVFNLILLLRRGTPGVLTGGYSRLGFGAVCLVAVFLASRALWAPFWIPSGSMKPTLLVGDYVIVTRVFGGPQLGDVVVFRHPGGQGDFIKRVIGLPGDRVQLRQGQLYVNDQPASLRPDGTFSEVMARQGPMAVMPRCANGPVGLGDTCEKEQLIETLPGGVSYRVLDIAMMASDDTPPYVVPQDHYFVLGDNRDNSLDSRVPASVGGVGFVPAANIIGRARLVLFSSAGTVIGDVRAWRRDRYFQKVE